jgi:hypothetical protein
VGRDGARVAIAARHDASLAHVRGLEPRLADRKFRGSGGGRSA